VEEEVKGMGKEDLEEHRVVEESIESVRREEKRCITRCRTRSSLFAKTGCVPG
jgi:hypothetical protein